MKNMEWLKKTNLYMIISAAIIALAAILSICGLGFNMGIDFQGGALLKYDVGEEIDAGVIEAALRSAGITEFQIARAGEGDVKTELQVRTKDLGENVDEIRMAFEDELVKTYANLSFITLDTVGAVAGRDLVANAVKSCLIVFVCLLIYVSIRFDFNSGVAALTALAHDVLIMCSFMVFARGLYQINSPFIAALLTIIGYSINNTIVIFDRIRENGSLLAYKQMPKIDMVAVSVSQTLTRTINTTITTLFTLVALYVLGVDSIREFTFPLIVGMLAGIYSSVLISGQLWARWVEHNTFGFITRFLPGKKHAKRA